MIITVDPSAHPPVALSDAGTFTAFAVRSRARDAGALTSALRSSAAGSFDGHHAWIAPAWLRSVAPADPAWAEGFAGMLAFAQSRGWIDDAGCIRAHIEQ